MPTLFDRINQAKVNRSAILSLSGLELNTIPGDIANLENLKILNLRDNNLSHVSENSFPQSLEVLYLANNNIEHIDKDAFHGLKLKVIDLQNNHLKNLPRSLGEMKYLRRLFLENNQIVEIPQYVYQLQSLIYFNCYGNELKIIDHNLEQLRNIKYLNLGGNDIHTIDCNFAILKDLESISLSQNKLTKFPSSIMELSKLKYASLLSNQIVGEITIGVDKTRNLTLILGDNKITTMKKQFNSLNELQIYFNPLKGNLYSLLQQVSTVYYDSSQTNNFLSPKNQIDQNFKVVDTNGKSNFNKILPPDLEKKYNLRNRGQILLNKLRKK